MSNRIQELIILLEDEIDRSPKQRLSGGNKRVVDCERILDLLGDLKVVVPEEVRLAQTILAERDAILHDSESQATKIIANARLEAERLIANDTTMSEAKERADELVHQAQKNADEVTQNARDYAQTVMEEVQRYLTHYIKLIDGTREDLRRNYRMRDSANDQKQNEKETPFEKHMPNEKILKRSVSPTEHNYDTHFSEIEDDQDYSKEIDYIEE